MPASYEVRECVGIPKQPDSPGELYFSLRPEFPDAKPTEEEEEAKSKLEQFVMVLRVAFQEHEPTIFRGYFDRVLSNAQATFSLAGFFPNAISDLELFKKEVVQVAGSRIKSRYTAKLFWAVLFASFAMIALGLVIQGVSFMLGSDRHTGGKLGAAPMTAISGFYQWESAFSFANTGLLLAGAMWGLLFASMTRNIDPTFDTLVTPDADLMEPWMRLLFFGIPSLVISLLFQTEFVLISFGGRVSTSDINQNAVVAVLMGLLLGIAERALPKEVENWSKRILPSTKPD